MKTPVQGKTVVRLEIAPQAIGWILATITGVWLLSQLWVIVLLVVVALIFAGTFNPLVVWMEKRGITRTPALALLFLGSVVVASLFLFLTVPPLLEQLALMVRGAPAAREQLIVLLEKRGVTTPLAHAVQNAGLEQTFTRIEGYLLGYSSQAVVVIGYFATTVVLSFYFLADSKRTQGALYAIVPRGYHMRLARIIYNLENIVGGYMRGQLITSRGDRGVHLPAPARLPGPQRALPRPVRGADGRDPLRRRAPGRRPRHPLGAPRGRAGGARGVVALFLYMEFESRILVPRVYGHVLRLSPTAVVLALLAGGTLLGVIGALLALPIAAGLQMILEELRVEMPGDDSDDRPARARNAKTEATYERMSAGATAPEAGLIARDLAHDLRDADADAEDAARDEARKAKPAGKGPAT